MAKFETELKLKLSECLFCVEGSISYIKGIVKFLEETPLDKIILLVVGYYCEEYHKI